MQPSWLEFAQDIVITIHANIRELKERRSFAEPEDLLYIDGKLQAYNEILAVLRSSAEDFNLPYQDFGL